jgi:flagellin
MSLSIGTNNGALFASAAATSSARSMETSMERLSSGKRINSAADDAAGVAIASRLSAEIRGANQSIRNALDGQALINTAEGAHKEIGNILQRMREVAVQSANDTNNSQDRANLQAEMNAMGTEIDRIAGTTTWAGANLMNGGSLGKDFSFQVGAAVGDKNQIAVNIDGMTMADLSIGTSTVSAAFTLTDNNFAAASDLGTAGTPDFTIGTVSDNSATANPDQIVISAIAADGKLTIIHPTTSDSFTADVIKDDESTTAANMNAAFADLGIHAAVSDDNEITLSLFEVAQVTTPSTNIDVSSGASARTGITALDSAIETVNIQRSELGAVSNRLNHTVSNLTNISSNLSAAKGGIEDADFAVETTNLAKNQILQQASTAMLAQANASKQNVLSLLQG